MGGGTAAETHDCAGHGGEHEAHEYETLVFMLGAILLGTALLHLQTLPRFHSLPFTVVLFLLGLFFSLMAENGMFDGVGMLKRSYENWINIDPHLLLYVFLPALLCGDAMTIDTHIAKRTCGQWLLLAGPGVLIGSFSTAAVLYFCLPYGWSFWVSLTVGSILAATDPVAVVGLLKELGASPVLTLQIQGESLLNDGTALVLFLIAYGVTGGEEWGAGKVVVFALKNVVGAPLVGTAIGMFFYVWIRGASDKLNHSSSLIQILLTISCAYCSWMVAEGFLHMSGVLSTVMAALVLAHKMWPVVASAHAMNDFWHAVETLGNTLVFVLAGAMTGRAAMNTTPADWGWLLFVYVAATLIRLVMLLAFMPLLGRLGPRPTLADVLVMVWGGLRGMVGLALAILVRKELAGGQLSEQDGDRILFLVGGIAALTLLVNATSCPMLVVALGITQTPEGRNALIRNVAQRATKHTESLARQLAGSRAAKDGLMDPDRVMDMVQEVNDTVLHHLPGAHAHEAEHEKIAPKRGSLLSESSMAVKDQVGRGFAMLKGERLDKPDIDKLWQDFEEAKTALCRMGAPMKGFKFGKQLASIKSLIARESIDPATLKIVREVFLQAVQANYWEQVEAGRFVVGSVVPTLLLGSIKIARDQCGAGLMDWSALESDIQFSTRALQKPAGGQAPANGALRRAATAGNVSDSSKGAAGDGCLSRHYNQWRVAKNLEDQKRALRTVSSFMDAHLCAQSQISSFFGEGEDVDSAEEAFVIIESQISIFKAACQAGMIDRQLTNHVNNMSEVRHIAEQLHSFVLAAHGSGVLLMKEAEVILHPVAETVHHFSKKNLPKQTEENLDRRAAARQIQKAWRKFSAFHSVHKGKVAGALPTLGQPGPPATELPPAMPKVAFEDYFAENPGDGFEKTLESNGDLMPGMVCDWCAA